MYLLQNDDDDPAFSLTYMKQVVLNGMDIKDTKDVHAILAKALEFGNFYGNNFDALWDMLSTNVERPFSITWTNASLSRERLGDDFEMFLQLFRRLEEYDRKAPWPDKFKFILVD